MGNNKLGIGLIGWLDLTVPNADEVKEFYSKVIGWKTEPVSMGDYNDYNMIIPSTGKPAAGICHKKGMNSELPSQWLIYITVDNINKRAEKCWALGGKILVPPKTMGNYGKYCVIQDPAGAVCALFEPI